MAKGNGNAKESEVEKSKRILKEAQAKREKQCAEEFQALLKKHNCDVIISGQFSGTRIEYGLHFIAKI